jgi:hypothetical protein
MQIDSSDEQSQNAQFKNMATIEGDSNVTVVSESRSAKASGPSSEIELEITADESSEKKRTIVWVRRLIKYESIFLNHTFSGSTSTSIIPLPENDAPSIIRRRGGI